MKRFLILQQVSYRMTLILFTVLAANTCSAVCPLPEDSGHNFGGDPITDDRLHDMFMRTVLYRNSASCGTVRDRIA